MKASQHSGVPLVLNLNSFAFILLLIEILFIVGEVRPERAFFGRNLIMVNLQLLQRRFLCLFQLVHLCHFLVKCVLFGLERDQLVLVDFALVADFFLEKPEGVRVNLDLRFLVVVAQV